MTQCTRDFRIGRGPSLILALTFLCLTGANGAPQQTPPPQTASQQTTAKPISPQQNSQQTSEESIPYQPPNGAGGLCSTPPPSASNTNASEDLNFNCPNGNIVHILHQAERNFSVDFLTYLARNNGGGNVFVSPYSVYEALLLSFFTAAGQTEASLRKLLHLPENMAKLDALVAHSCSQKILNSQRAEQLRSANRIYLDKKLQPVTCVQEVLHDEIQQISFQEPGATETINAWVSQQTNGKIPNLLLPNSVSADSKLVLTNAAYFKDLWLSQFSPEKTNKSVFFLETQPSKTIRIQMMRQKGSFKVQRSMELGAMVLELPYTNTNVAMLVLLPPFARDAAGPKNPDVLEGIDGVLSRFSAAELSRLLDSDVTSKQVEVALPKWSATQSIELVQTLEAMGVGDLFKPTANLTDLTGQPGITFDSVVHQAKIDVDESGTEAAGATAIFSFRSSRPLQPESFICDHPFVYLIVDKTSKTVLFAGIYRFPPT